MLIIGFSQLITESLVTDHFFQYPSRLKAFSIAFCIASAVLAGGCADPIEKPIGDEVQEKFKRGITGQGQLGPIDRSDDRYIKGDHP